MLLAMLHPKSESEVLFALVDGVRGRGDSSLCLLVQSVTLPLTHSLVRSCNREEEMGKCKQRPN